MQAYEHHQAMDRWILVIAALSVIVVAAFGFALPPPEGWLLWLLALVTAAATWMCSSMTTSVDAQGVHWSLTWGVPSGHIAFNEIERAEAVKLNLFEIGKAGFGWTPWHGWLWRVAGSAAVEIFTTGGGRTTLATNDRQGLIDAIERFRGDR